MANCIKPLCLIVLFPFWTLCNAFGEDSANENIESPTLSSWNFGNLTMLHKFSTGEPDETLYKIVSETRYPTSPFRVAHDRVLVLYKHIEESRAHTVADVLRRETGVFVSSNRDFGSPSVVDIQGSKDIHVAFFIDDIPVNLAAYGNAETNWIPVGIIQKAEIIKGAASSAWGSALGGVVNIVTKTPGKEGAANSVTVSCGEMGTQDHRVELTGKTGAAGYFIHAGRMDSDVLRNGREFERHDAFAKVSFEAPDGLEMMMTLLYSEPVFVVGEYPLFNFRNSSVIRTFLSKFDMKTDLADDLLLEMSVHGIEQKHTTMSDTLVPADTLYSNHERTEQTKGLRGKFVWEPGFHVIVLGFDLDKTKFDLKIDSGSTLQEQDAPPTYLAKADMTNRAVYVSDRYTLGKWVFTTGIRLDDNDVSDSQLNPSLGLTYMPDEHTVFRLCVARGFTAPPLAWTATGGLFTRPNPELEAEEVLSYQAGFETVAIKYLWLKGTVFYHDMDNAFKYERYGDVNGDFYNMYINVGKIRRRGFDLDVETVSFHGLSFSSGFSYSLAKYYEELNEDKKYTWSIELKYTQGESFYAGIASRYVRWNLDDIYDSNLGDMIVDATIMKKLSFMEYTNVELFANIHNLFNGSQYTAGADKNPERCLEAGIRVSLPN